jgi:hypothetical protein
MAKPAPTIRDLYPHLTESELEEAERHFEQYIRVVLRMYERILADPNAYAEFGRLTGNEGTLGCNPQRSDSLLDNSPSLS